MGMNNLLNSIFQGFVDEVNLKWLEQNVLSLSTHQNISAHLNFLGNLSFIESVSSMELEIGGLINDIHLATFVNTALLDGIDQVFPDELFVENIEIRGK